MNKYLEKVALNAFKLRNVAKEVGVIPAAGSAWKSAVRRLRDGQGAALKGQELAKGRARLGDIDNNSFQKIVAQNRTHGFSGRELTGQVGSSGKLLNKPAVGNVGEVDRISMKRTSDNLHTHPVVQSPSVLRRQPEEMARLASGHTQASPSGMDNFNKFRNNLTPAHFGNARQELEKARNAHERFRESKEMHKEDMASGAFNHDERNDMRRDLMTERTAIKSLAKSHVEEARKLSPGPTNRDGEGDMIMLANKAKHSGDASERIVAPGSNTVSHTRIINNAQDKIKSRTIFFDHTPRKSK